MPELPEVETTRQSLIARIMNQTIRQVEVRRPDVIRGRANPACLLVGQTLTSIERTGKQLALISRDGGCVCIHLGMSGVLIVVDRKTPVLTHTHVIWSFGGSELRFRDPRRFGAVWTFANRGSLHEQHWSRLGEDALTIAPGRLHERLTTTRRPIKAALLDQRVLSGLGNIYADELLFACRIHPRVPANALNRAAARLMVHRGRRLLRRAIDAGGSSLRDYVNGNGEPGRHQLRHKVYGRSGLPCFVCETRLRSVKLAGRTTVFCANCQRINRR